jgi:hypothetical protein
MFDPIIQRIREMGSPGLIMSGSKDEGPLIGSVKPAPQPAGRGFYVERRTGSRLVQVALLEDAAAPATGQHAARPAASPDAASPAASHTGDRADGAQYRLPTGPGSSHRRI